MDQVTALLQQVGHYGGRTLPPALARQCRTLAGAPVGELDAVAASVVPMLAMLLLMDVGGSVVYSVDEVDDRPEGVQMKLAAGRMQAGQFQQVQGEGATHLKAWVELRQGSGTLELYNVEALLRTLGSALAKVGPGPERDEVLRGIHERLEQWLGGKF